jgi:hypothetical protein
VTYKSSTAGDREKLSSELPSVFTKLEIMLPVTWNTPVVHIFLCQTVKTLTDVGDVCVAF